MKTSLFVVAAFVAAVAFVGLVAPSTAEAGPVWITTLVSADAGSTQTQQLTAKKCYCVQPTIDPMCIHLDTFDGGSLAADCTKDVSLDTNSFTTVAATPSTGRARLYCFDSANSTSITARQYDGGAVNANLYQHLANPQSPNYQCTIEVEDRMN